jgi:phospholipase/carboxylesterase
LGYQWFSVQGITEANRPARVAAAMPAFLADVGAWQQSEDATAATTVLIGFSQGAIMALESTSTQPSPAGQVVAIAGRFATLPVRAALRTTLHLLHGKLDAVIAYRYALEAAHHLLGLGDEVSVDVLPLVGHEIDAKMIELTVERLRGRNPQRRAGAKLPEAPARA